MRNALSIVIIPFLVGLVFSIGLFISGMTNPHVVIGFLRFWDNWNPALMFVMLSAVIVSSIFYKLAFKRKMPLFDVKFDIPLNKQLDKKLVIGSAIFGIGWGMLGICPGPGIANLALLQAKFLGFIGAMLVGMLIHHLYQKTQKI